MKRFIGLVAIIGLTLTAVTGCATSDESASTVASEAKESESASDNPFTIEQGDVPSDKDWYLEMQTWAEDGYIPAYLIGSPKDDMIAIAELDCQNVREGIWDLEAASTFYAIDDRASYKQANTFVIAKFMQFCPEVLNPAYDPYS